MYRASSQSVPASLAKIMDTVPKSRRLPISLASLSANGMKDRGKAAGLLRDLLSNAVDVDAVSRHTLFAKLLLAFCLTAFSSIQHTVTDWPESSLCC